jgi:hypothetical protein
LNSKTIGFGQLKKKKKKKKKKPKGGLKKQGHWLIPTAKAERVKSRRGLG